MRRIAPCATTQYRHPFAALVATMIISFSPFVSPDSRSSSASWYAKNARNSSGRCAKVRNTLGTKPAFSCTSRILARMSSGNCSSGGTGKRLIALGSLLVVAGFVIASTPELQRVQPRIEPAVGDQILVRALLGDAARLDRDDAVGTLDGREAVRDHDAGPALPPRLPRLLPQTLRFGIEGPGRPLEG